MKRILTISSVAALCLSIVGARAAAPATGAITQESRRVTWTGSFDGVHPLAPAPEVPCALGACDTFQLDVALGDLWETADGAVEVAIRWTYDGITDLDLIVSRDGAEVARSAAVDSNAESVFIPEAPDGTYTVSIVPANNFSDQGFAAIPYEGLAEVELRSTDGPGTDLLPNLESLAPHNFHIATAANVVPFPENPLVSCYPEETVESQNHPTRCLRFDQTIANTGAGPLELRFLIDQALSTNEEDQRLEQRITRDDGTTRRRLADSYELHPAHGHVHYRGFGRSYLFPYDLSTGRTGDGTPSRIGNKVGFCVIDVLLLEEYWGGTEGAKANGPRTRSFPTCNAPQETDEDGVWMVQGIAVGWADVYGWNLADQYIDITGLADGIYQIEQVANPTGSVLEADAGDNCATSVIRIEGDTVTDLGISEHGIACTFPITLAS